MDAVLRFDNVRVQYPAAKGVRNALDGCTLSVPAGAVLALLGPNGAGKSTFVRCALGLTVPRQGDVRVLGHRAGRKRLAHIGVVVENPGIYSKLTAREYLRYFAGLWGLEGTEARIQSTCEELGFELPQGVLGTASLGQRQKVHLVRSLMHQPRLLLWDEPFSHLDPDSQDSTVSALKRRVTGSDGAAVVATHNLAIAESVASMVAVLHRGRIRHLTPWPPRGDNGEVEFRFGRPVRSRELPSPRHYGAEAWKAAARAPLEDTGSGGDDEASCRKYVLEGIDLGPGIPGIIANLVERGLPITAVVPVDPGLKRVYRRYTA